MKRTIGVFKNLAFSLDVYNSQELELNSKNSKDKMYGFTEYVDVLGNKHNDLFIRKVSQSDLDYAYDLQVNVIYKDDEFETYEIGRSSLDENTISLFTNEIDKAQKHQFEKKEQFVYKKSVSLDDIDAIVEVKIPILRFANLPVERDKIPKSEIRNYIKSLN